MGGGFPEVGHVDEHLALGAVAEELLLAAAVALLFYVGQVYFSRVGHCYNRRIVIECQEMNRNGKEGRKEERERERRERQACGSVMNFKHKSHG